METALEFVKRLGLNHKPKLGRLVHFPAGKFYTYFVNNDECVAKQVDENLTLYYNDKNEVVGVQIWE